VVAGPALSRLGDDIQHTARHIHGALRSLRYVPPDRRPREGEGDNLPFGCPDGDLQLIPYLAVSILRHRPLGD